MDGFSFNGIHCEAIGCRYHPDAKERGGEMEDYEISELNPEGRDGGYYLGARVKPREFEQACFFEDIEESGLEQIHRWLRRDTHGEQIFDARPYAAYDAVTSKRIIISLYDHVSENGKRLLSGTFTAYFVCHYPFARMLKTFLPDEGTVSEHSRTGLLNASIMPSTPDMNSRSFLLYNPGTERAHTVIRQAGDTGSGQLIRNLTTGQRCRVVNLAADSLQDGAALELDSEKGQTRIVLGDEQTMAFPMHDEGYIELAPCTPFVRTMTIAHTEGGNVVTADGVFQNHMVGQHLYLDGWKKIREINDDHTAVISAPAASTGSTATPIVTMNEIEVSGEGMALSRFEIEYIPRIR